MTPPRVVVNHESRHGKRVKSKPEKKLAERPKRPILGDNINDILQSQFEI